MLKCRKCGHMNTIDRVVCAKCHSILVNAVSYDDGFDGDYEDEDEYWVMFGNYE